MYLFEFFFLKEVSEEFEFEKRNFLERDDAVMMCLCCCCCCEILHRVSFDFFLKEV